jgi:uncharacterized Ntn-hydrolase superfamily protein
MTFSLVGRCVRTGMLGVVVTSSSPAVAARCAWARARVGAVATQNVTDPALGPLVLDRIESGLRASDALDDVMGTTPHAAFRQLGVIDSLGGTAAYSGTRTLGRYSSRAGSDCIAAGNLLADEKVPSAMIRAFERRPQDHLADRLLEALRAGQAAGGEEGPVRSCGLLVVETLAWPITDLRVDWHDDPISELGRLWEMWHPLESDYILRATDPEAAPSYGVAGDE